MIRTMDISVENGGVYLDIDYSASTQDLIHVTMSTSSSPTLITEITL